MARLILPIFLLLLPIAEIAGFILVGRWLGLLPTLLLIVLLTMAGAALLRIQGLGALRRLGQNDGAEAGRQIVHGALIVVAGILLIIPGFITGAIGILLFIPAVRDLAWKHFRDRIVIFSNIGGGPAWPGGDPSHRGRRDDVVDLDDTEFHRNDRPRPPLRKRDD